MTTTALSPFSEEGPPHSIDLAFLHLARRVGYIKAVLGLERNFLSLNV